MRRREPRPPGGPAAGPILGAFAPEPRTTKRTTKETARMSDNAPRTLVHYEVRDGDVLEIRFNV